MPDGSVKLGFRAHYPQLETKLTTRGADMDDIGRSSRPSRARCASASANSSSPRTTSRSRASCSRSSRAARARSPSRRRSQRPDLRAHRPPAGGGGGVPSRRGVARGRRAVRRRGPDGRARGGRAHPRDGGGGGAGGATADRGDARARRPRRPRRGRGPHRVRRGDLPGDRHRRRRRVAAERIVGGREWVRLRAVEMGLDCCAATPGAARLREDRFEKV